MENNSSRVVVLEGLLAGSESHENYINRSINYQTDEETRVNKLA